MRYFKMMSIIVIHSTSNHAECRQQFVMYGLLEAMGIALNVVTVKGEHDMR